MQQVATGFTLVEAPVWDPAQGLYFSDIHAGGVFLLDRRGQVSQVIPKRRGVGGMALHADGGLVVGGRDIAHVDLTGSPATILAMPSDVEGAFGFNDFTTDAQGRIYVGSVHFRVFANETPQPGRLNVVDLDGSVRSVAEGVMLTNGLGFSPDGKRLYHSDAGAKIVRVYDVWEDGSVGPWQVFADFRDMGSPDGLKVAEDGSVWVAVAYAGKVCAFHADGRPRQTLDLPSPIVASVCFGGDDMRDLYIVTGPASGSHQGEHVKGGSVFLFRADVAGVPLTPARVRRH